MLRMLTKLCHAVDLQADAQVEKVRSGHKRKLAEMQSSIQAKVAETEQKLAKLNSKAGKTQGLGGMLQQMMAAAE